MPRSEVYIYGFHPVLHALKNRKRVLLGLEVTQEVLVRYQNILGASFFNKMGQSLRLVKSEKEMAFRKKIEHDDHLQGVILKTLALDDGVSSLFLGEKEEDTVLFLDRLSDPRNIGAILRTACLFGVSSVITTHKHAPAENSALLKAACGGAEYVRYLQVSSLVAAIQEAKDCGFWVCGLDLSEDSMATWNNIKEYKKIALVLGGEGEGMRKNIRNHCDFLWQIPTVHHEIDSFNVSVASGIALYEITRLRGMLTIS